MPATGRFIGEVLITNNTVNMLLLRKREETWKRQISAEIVNLFLSIFSALQRLNIYFSL